MLYEVITVRPVEAARYYRSLRAFRYRARFFDHRERLFRLTRIADRGIQYHAVRHYPSNAGYLQRKELRAAIRR